MPAPPPVERPSAAAADPDLLEGLAAQAEALFASDSRGRLLESREPAPGAAPLFLLSRCALGCLWRFAARLDDPVVAALSRLASRESGWTPGGRLPPPPPERAAAFERILAHAGYPSLRPWRGPVWDRPDAGPVPPPRPAGARVVSLAPGERDPLARVFPSWAPGLDAWPRLVAVTQRGEWVALCASVREAPRPGGADEAGVETHPAHRRRGFGSLAVAAWMEGVHAAGRRPFYSTSWENRASRALAGRLGLRWVGETLHWSEADAPAAPGAR